MIPYIPEPKPRQPKEESVPEAGFCDLKCTRKKNGRVIFRWEHEEILDEMRKRVKENKDVVKKRNCMCEHPFGTIKRGFNQGYLLLKGSMKVGGEMGFTMIAYNMRRVINILGMDKLMEFMNHRQVQPII